MNELRSDRDVSRTIKLLKGNPVNEPKIKLPKGWKDPIIVLGYNGEIRLMCVMEKEVIKNWTKKDTAKLRRLKIRFLEKYLGYKIVKMSRIVLQKDYEKYAKEHEK